MAMSPRLELRQSQTLVMTPQLQQAIKLLQLSNLELNTYVEQELEKNPLLERTESEPLGGDGDGDPAAAAREASDTQETRAAHDAAGGIEGPLAGEAPVRESLEADYDNLYTNDSLADRPAEDPGTSDSYIRGRGGNSRFENDEFGLEQTLSERTTLREHLLGQLQVELTAPADRLIGANLIDLLDEAGYLAEDLGLVAERLGCGLAEVERVLARLQGFDPPGVFASSLKECLALQLKDRNRLDPAMQTLLDNLEMLARRDVPGLIRICGVDAEDVADMIAEVRALNPKPGLAFDSEITQTVVPDVFVRQNQDGGWSIELNNDTLPRLLVNTRYHARVAGATRNKTDKAYLSECLNSANWLIKSLDQRANTILKVASELVRQQDGFFVHGVHYLRPLNLRTIAEAIGMHESTVSRVTANKYMATPRGIFEMKYFFTSAIASTAGGEAHSAEAVRHRIRELILAEGPDSVLSDDAIVEILVSTGIDIARRTVAKYRETMRIPSSVQRRRLKQLQA